jgi:hypothetical protein
MESSDLYVFKDRLVTGEYRISYISLIKLLYLTKVIDKDIAIDCVAEFKMFFV